MKQRLKQIYLKWLRALTRAVLSFREGRFRAWEEEYYTQTLVSQLSSVGEGFSVGGQLTVTHPKSLVVGKGVRIGKGCMLASFGGLLIGDHSELMHDVCIYTLTPAYSEHPSPTQSLPVPRAVTIGKNVVIEPHVIILPGVQIGDSAVIRMGSVVSEDVAAGAIVKPALPRVKALRSVSPSIPLPEGEKIFFILSTGRAGSSSITAMLNQHPFVICRHEPKRPLVRLSTEYLHGKKSRAETQAELRALFQIAGLPVDKWYGECDTKFVNLVELLSELFPKARFIWLMRDGRQVVNSTYARKWYWPETEQALSKLDWHEIKGMDTWHYYRIQGDQAGAMSTEAWQSLTPFAKNCWYWTYWNEQIETQLSHLPQERWMRIRLEELENRQADLLAFLGLPEQALRLVHANRAAANTPLMAAENWSSQQSEEFQQWCGAGMKKWYEQ